MAEEHIAPIIVKKIKKGGGGHHGGAWKIAYADFVTAMMAFFLLMWLLGSTSKAQKEGIAEYFQTPLHMVLMGPSLGQSDSALKNTGGKDVTKKQGQVKPVEGDPGKLKTVKLEDVKEVLKQAEKVKLEALKAKIEQAIEDNPTLQQFKSQLKLDITSEGLRVQIIDEQNRPMFENAKAELQPYAKTILREIGKTLNGVDNKISLSGHTDAAGYANGDHGYSNWELSADRANASRRELIAGGMDETKLMRVVGLGSAIMMDKENPFNPINRRISLIVMNKETEEELLKDNEQISVSEHDKTQVEALQNKTEKPSP
ncbi:flagellar motor protein MotB [Methylophilus sp. QUAN]|uniref:flagellar motor protein MotB n=1 Tax=unclassified Methylophilus TaxID=2630143 RepID=UPI00188DD631|nr:flagellar motor protein MotB [Methylophilus sp. QUAN]MBF4991177.1 flagellar motor protein MotB [Methylophilus sp. QUAN]